MSARDELARDIFLADNSNAAPGLMEKEWDDDPTKYSYAHNIAQGLAAKGYRKPRSLASIESAELDAIRSRATAYADHGTPGLAAPRDRAVLLAALDAALSLAEEWRYKGEFGWGAWQEGQGPDPEGYILDGASADLRTAIHDALTPEEEPTA